MAQHARPVGPTTNQAATFSPEMTQGYAPARAPMHGWRRQLGHAVSQTTHTSAPLEPAMAQGTPGAKGPNPAQPDLHTSAFPPDVAIFSIEMVLGSRPERARLFLAPRLPLPLSQPTHTAAPFSVEMAIGAHQDRNREFLPLRTGLVAQTPDGAPFSVEMAIGYHPDSPRLFTVIPHLGTFAIQPVQVAAPFSQEMVAGSRPDRNREQLPLRTGTTLWISDIVILTPDMTQGSRPDRPRLTYAQQPGPAIPPHIDPFSNETVIGYQPSRPQLARGQQGFLVVPPTVIPFSNEMVVGWHPDQPRLFYPLRKIGVTDPSSAPHVASPFSIEMITGWMPARSRQRDPLRYLQGPTWYWPTDSTTGPLIVLLFAQRMLGPVVINQAMATPLTRRQEDL